MSNIKNLTIKKTVNHQQHSQTSYKYKHDQTQKTRSTTNVKHQKHEAKKPKTY